MIADAITIVEALERLGLPTPGRSGRMACPIHGGDNKTAFSIHADGYRWTCHTRGCHSDKGKDSGDAIDLVKAVRGCPFKEANDFLGIEHEAPTDKEREERRRIAQEREKERLAQELVDVQKGPSGMAQELLALCDRHRQWLYRDTIAQAYLAEERGWKPETIQRLTVEWGLCYFRAVDVPKKDGSGTYSVENAVGFLYPCGLKLRWTIGGHPFKECSPKDGKRFIWHPRGLGNGIWRSQLRAFERCPNVVITESETDLIALVDAGIFDPWHADPTKRTAVVSCSGADNFKSGWGPLFEGKRVGIAFDDDEAGQDGARKVAAKIHSYAAKTWFVQF